MFAKAVILATVFAAASAITTGYLDGHLGVQSEQTVRGFGGTVSHQAKSVSGPFSHATKSDTRVSNNGVYGAYAAPAYAHHGYAAAPIAHAAPAFAHHGYAAPLAHHAYAAPAYAHAPVAHHGYAAPLAHHAYAAPAYAHGPAYHHGYAAPALAKAHPAGLLGVAYSPATAVAHTTFSGFNGIQFAY